jgi:hypothetical protein
MRSFPLGVPGQDWASPAEEAILAARSGGPATLRPFPGAPTASRCVKVDRLVNDTGGVTLLNRLILRRLGG